MRAADLFAAPEMQLRYPGEVELRREGWDEGQPHGYDGLFTAADVLRTIASRDTGAAVGEWFARQLESFGWTDRGDGWFERDRESIFVRVDRDGGMSRVASMIEDAHASELQDQFEKAAYSAASEGATVVTIFYGLLDG